MPLSSKSVASAAQHRLARIMDALPDRAAIKVGRGPVVVDGQTLDPHLAMVLAFNDRLRPEDPSFDVANQRSNTSTAAAIAAGKPVVVGPVVDLVVDGELGKLKARHYSPPSANPNRPLVVFFHGGGFVVGDLDTHDQPCRLISAFADVHVLAIDYRLAPEHPFPAPVNDATAAFAWAVVHAEELGADPSRVAVAGDSAGGNLAAVVAQVTRDEGTTQPVAQFLLYPATDSSVERPSKSLFAEGFFLTRRQMDWYWDTYSAGGSHTNPRLSPMCADSLAGLAPAVVTTAAFDPLRDEGEAYAEALRSAGVPVVLRRAPGLVHGYLNMTGIHRASLLESIAVIGAFGAVLDTLT